MSAGVTAYFAFSILTFGIAKANGTTELRGGVGALVAFGAYVVTMIAVLWVNDWLGSRYPLQPKVSERALDADPSVTERL